MTEIVLGVDDEVGGVDVESFDHPLKELGLMHDALFHEVDDLVLNCHKVLDPVIKLHL